MGRFVTAITVFSLLIFCGFTRPTPTLCEQIKQKTPMLHKFMTYSFQRKSLEKINPKTFPLIDRSKLLKLSEEDMPTSDSSFAMGWFDINPNRLGLIFYNKACEGDRRIGYVSLYVIDNCDSIIYVNNCLTTTDDAPFYYEVSSSIKDRKTLTRVIEHSSEWVDVTDEHRKDTLFTETYKIDLSNVKIDTIYRKATFKPMK